MRFWSLNTPFSHRFQGIVFHSYTGLLTVLMMLNSYLFLYRPSYRVYVCVSFGFPEGICFLDNPSDARHAVDTCSFIGEHERGYFVPNFCYCAQLRASLSTGVHWECVGVAIVAPALNPSPFWGEPIIRVGCLAVTVAE